MKTCTEFPARRNKLLSPFADSNAILHDATFDPGYRAEIYRIIREQRKLQARRERSLAGNRSIRGGGGFEREFERNEREQSNSSILFGTQYF
jgi:hypothetical protein